MNAAIEQSYNETFGERMQYLSEFKIFQDTEDWVETQNVWARPLRPQTFGHIQFVAVDEETKFNYAAFTMNRALTALYEQDFLYLPESADTGDDIVAELRTGYSQALRGLAQTLIPGLERRTLGFVEEQIQVSEGWDKRKFANYFSDKIEQANNAIPPSFDIIRKSNDPKLLTRMLLIQHAVDFLPESSHMARYAKGDFGEVQSALFRVLIDEFGYGAHRKKHSKLFKDTLLSVDMAANSHAYWMFYLNSTLLNNNYFHKITTHPEHIFEYIGAITYAENTFSAYCDEVKNLLKECFGTQVDVNYYKEHVHIDQHHGRMTVEELVLPVIDKYGNAVIPEIIRGMETAARLQDIMEEDFSAQMDWMAKAADYRDLAHHIKPRVEARNGDIPVAYLDEPRGELSVTHCHDGDELCIVDEGVLRFCHGYECFSDLGAGDCIVIKKNRLHGAIVLSQNCKYRILSIGKYSDYADYQI